MAKRNFPSHGNYRRYYGYRYKGGRGDIDPRLEIVKEHPAIISGSCLDIGCNQGAVTMQMVFHFDINSIVGVDIDRNLIKSAVFDMRMKQNELDEQQGNQLDLFSKISFRTEDYVYSPSDTKYNTILCLSITKWIHVANGDEGIRLLFKKIAEQLEIGGHLILEAQPWKSYTKYKMDKAMVQKLSLKPTDFQVILESHGLQLLFQGKPTKAYGGFRERDVQVFKKSAQPIQTTEPIHD